uniref:uncharacterized protein si:ch211-191i18.2 isoform X1 n=1 Tax=Scatophagus argus TaxID=75038 RepID=UPI001ED7CE41|nr:uncharacterized protein si:ch211-191i18.2 isoform X1 [Scatophagus argus]XP_046274432.1 uncharacterized protein si:ch211-191i18.2 isoform X1 [Scatophagus argus]
MFSFQWVFGASLVLLASVAVAQYDDFTPTPDYDSDYNATFEYSFYSNASSEDLDRFSERFVDQDEEEEEDMGGWHEKEEATVTMATTRSTTEQGRVNVHNVASLPVSLEIKTLVCTVMILASLNTQQLRCTL